MSITRLHNLSLAITKYGEVSVAIMYQVKALGNAIIAALPKYLGDEANAYGVDPFAEDWRMADYRDQKFSFHGIDTLEVDSIQMGVAVCIPHIKDAGNLRVRVVVEFVPEGGDLKVAVGDGPGTLAVSDPHDDDDVQRVCEAIYEYLLAMFADPVSNATAQRRGKLGFIQS